MAERRRLIGLLALTQILSWGSLYYAFGVLAKDIQQSLDLPAPLIYGAYAWALLLAGLCATPVGLLIDRAGGRRVMAAGSVLAGSGMLLLAFCSGPSSYLLAWTVIGIAMALSLYEAAFATINHCMPQQARSTISALTLFGGLASTAFWPLSLVFSSQFGWRGTYLLYAAMQLLLCLPAHLGLPKAHVHQAPATAKEATLTDALRHPVFWRLAAAFAINTLIFSALSVHLIPLFAHWHPSEQVVLAAMAIGPMQVLGRYVEMRCEARFNPSDVGRLVFLVIPLGLAVAALWGQHTWGMLAFCVAYGLSNGVMTILRGTLPGELFGQRHYGAIAGALAAPALIAKASGPLFLVTASRDAAPELSFGVLAALGLLSLAAFPRRRGF